MTHPALRLTLDVPASARAGDRIPIRFEVENAADAPVELTLAGRTLTFDIVVEDATGTVAWRRLEGAALQMIARLRILSPGERLTLRSTWNGRAAPGNYTVRGLLLTDAAPLESPRVPLQLRAR